MISALNKKPDGTIEITITTPWEEVKIAREGVVALLSKQTTIAGFRRGKAPKKLVEGSLDQDKIRDEVLKTIIPKAVSEAIEKHRLRPILTPQISIQEFQDGKDLRFVARTCETPEIDLGNYQQQVKEITAKGKIIVPGKQPFDSTQDKPEKPKLDDILQAVARSVKVTLPAILVDHEVNHLLSQTLDEIKRLGLTLDQYLSSTGKTAEGLREEQARKATNDLILELAMQKIAEVEKITVEETEIKEAIEKAKTEEERKSLETNRYLLARVLRQQKTLDFLTKL